MPLYYFHTQDNQTLPDRAGTELPDLTAAKVEAVRLAAKTLTQHAETFWTEGEWTLQVTDHTGLTLFVLTFLATEAPATRRDRPL
ncbi:DUF6894 family protein [Roseomonas sp. BN140053]|uniref:DUF6894 family protein n=1 Tax=Roseomonas sp. BN140053 TaxID=3391898 RepID=UPI0039EC0963